MIYPLIYITKKSTFKTTEIDIINDYIDNIYNLYAQPKNFAEEIRYAYEIETENGIPISIIEYWSTWKVSLSESRFFVSENVKSIDDVLNLTQNGFSEHKEQGDKIEGIADIFMRR